MIQMGSRVSEIWPVKVKSQGGRFVQAGMFIQQNTVILASSSTKHAAQLMENLGVMSVFNGHSIHQTPISMYEEAKRYVYYLHTQKF